MSSWAVMATVRGVEPSKERRAANAYRSVCLWGEPAELRVRTSDIVIGAPSCELATSVRERAEQCLISKARRAVGG